MWYSAGWSCTLWCMVGYTPPVNRITDRYKNITFPGGNKYDHFKIEATTRMHSSRMRTSCLLTVCWSLLPGGVCSWGCGLGGVCSEGGVCSRGMSALGGVCFWGVVWEVWSRGYIPACTEADPPPVDRQTLVKILPWPNFVAAGKNTERRKDWNYGRRHRRRPTHQYQIRSYQRRRVQIDVRSRTRDRLLPPDRCRRCYLYLLETGNKIQVWLGVLHVLLKFIVSMMDRYHRSFPHFCQIQLK